MLDGEWAETDVIEFIGGTGGLDMATEQPNELVGTEGWGFGNMAIVVLGLTFLREFEIRAKFVVYTREVSLEVGGGGDVDRDGKTRRERRVETVVRKERSHFG